VTVQAATTVGVMKTQTLCFRPSGKSVIGSLWSGEKDPTKIVEGGPRPPKGISGILRPEDSDCSGNSIFAFLWEPLCVVGKGITKCAGNFGWIFQNKWIWIAVVIILLIIV
jgi:hypothetical protein